MVSDWWPHPRLTAPLGGVLMRVPKAEALYFRVHSRPFLPGCTHPAGSRPGADLTARFGTFSSRRSQAETAKSIDDMEEVLLEDTFAVLRQALGTHFEEVSKRGLLSGSSPGS